MPIGHKRKTRWFHSGAKALRRRLPEATALKLGLDSQPLYACPICIRVFPSAAVTSDLTAAAAELRWT